MDNNTAGLTLFIDAEHLDHELAQAGRRCDGPITGRIVGTTRSSGFHCIQSFVESFEINESKWFTDIHFAKF